MGGTRRGGALALFASSTAAASASFHAAILGQRAARFSTVPPEASGTLGVSGAGSFLVAAHSGTRKSSIGLHARGPQCGDRIRYIDLVAGSLRGRRSLDRS